MDMKSCRKCGKEVSPNAETCPRCDEPRPGEAEFPGTGYEWKSAAQVLGVPLVHVAYGRDRNRKVRVARGIVAIGQYGVGVVSIAQFGVGLIGIGQFVFGWAVLAQFALASLLGFGQFATGSLWCGGQMTLGASYFHQYGSGFQPGVNVFLGIAFSVLSSGLVYALLFLKGAGSSPGPSPSALAGFLVEPLPEAAKPTLRAAEPILPQETKLGPYTLRECIGRGGMGTVYRAEHAHLGRTVALKVLPADLASDPEFVERFHREAQVLAKLQHPNIVSIYDMGRDGNTHYLAMELIDGTNLRSVMKAGGLTPAQALHLVPKLCDALEYAHSKGVIHRDIKPENILVGRDGEPRIADFGLARVVRGEGVPLTLTRTNVSMGTPDYMAPEQRTRMKEVDHRADIFSMGVVLYELLTGQLPVGRFDPPARKVQVDLRIDSVVLRALEQDRERRYARVVDMGTEIRGITSG